MSASNAAAASGGGMYKSSSSSTTAEDLSDKRVQVRRSATTDTTNSNDSLSVSNDNREYGSNLSLHKSTSSNNNPNNSSPSSAAAAPAAPYLECDYDLNPTVLYQAIEAKQWEYALSVFTKHQQDDQSSTWVIRKERTGKLRWRLLPLHAAVIFGSPLALIELLLADYPAAAKSKDDQGMLPLHLAFRNEAQWDVIEELLTAYPTAVFVSDRKGRTPLHCGLRSTSSNSYFSSAASVVTTSTNIGSKLISSSGRPSKSSSSSIAATTISRTNTGISDAGTVVAASSSSIFPAPSHKASFRSVVNILDVYAQVAVSGERTRAEKEARTLAKVSITQLKDSHTKTLSALKSEWEKQQAEVQRQKQEVTQHNSSLEERVQQLEQELAQQNQEERRLRAKYRRLELKLQDAEERISNGNNNPLGKTQLLPQTSRQDRVHAVLGQVQEMVAERDQMRSIFLKDQPLLADEQQEKELSLIEDLEQLLRIEVPPPLQPSVDDNEEKKVDDARNND